VGKIRSLYNKVGKVLKKALAQNKTLWKCKHNILKENKIAKKNQGMIEDGFGTDVHLHLVLRPSSCYLTPWTTSGGLWQVFLFRHTNQTFYVSAPVGKHNCLAIAKHLFTISNPLLWERTAINIHRDPSSFSFGCSISLSYVFAKFVDWEKI